MTQSPSCLACFLSVAVLVCHALDQGWEKQSPLPTRTLPQPTMDKGPLRGGCNLHAWTSMVSGWEVGKELIHTKFLANALCCCWPGAASTMPTSECVHPLHPAPAQARHSARELFFVAFSSLIPLSKVQPESTIFHKALTSSSFYFCHLEEPQPLA